MTIPPPASLPPRLARLHAWAHRQPWLTRFTLVNRLLLAMAFLPSGLVKASGDRFTTLPIENKVGFFFEAMYQTGAYWRFIGFVQLGAAVLLLIPATATLGAILFLPVGISVFLITWGIGFGGTTYITAGMLLACLYLVAWDADRVWAAASHLFGRRAGTPILAAMPAIERAGWLLGAAAGVGLVMTTREYVPTTGCASPPLRGRRGRAARRRRLDHIDRAGTRHRDVNPIGAPRISRAAEARSRSWDRSSDRGGDRPVRA